MKKCILLIVMLFMVGCNKEPRKLTIQDKHIKKYRNQERRSKSIRHLYVISNSGKIILYSIVKGKVTSSRKEMSRVIAIGHAPQIEFLYWWDSKGRYHKNYVIGGQIIHISDSPLPVKNILINMEDEP